MISKREINDSIDKLMSKLEISCDNPHIEWFTDINTEDSYGVHFNYSGFHHIVMLDKKSGIINYEKELLQ